MIELHIFTNSTVDHSPSTALVEQTAESFAVTFGQVATTVWCDRHPNEQQACVGRYAISYKLVTCEQWEQGGSSPWGIGKPNTPIG